MITKLFTIYDRLAEQSGPVFEARNVAVAQRKYTQFFKERPDDNPEEYALLCLGRIDHDANFIEPLEVPEDVTKIIEDELKIEEKLN